MKPWFTVEDSGAKCNCLPPSATCYGRQMVGKAIAQTVDINERFLEGFKLAHGEERARRWDSKLPGFGVVIGKRRISFVVFRRVKGEANKSNVTLGHWAPGKLRAADAGLRARTMTVANARDAAIQTLGQMRSGVDPNASGADSPGGPTLGDGLDLHVSNMRKENASPRSIGTIESEVPRLLGEWMDRPIAELKGSHLIELHNRLTDDDKPYLANRIVAQVSAVWNSLDRASDDGLPGRNPSRAVTRNAYTPSRERVDDLAAWHGKVQSMENGVRRDLQMFALFTGMRSEAARHARWEHIDWNRSALIVPRPKGGEARAFELPLPKTIVDALRARQRDNRDVFRPYGGDAGFVFPSLTRSSPYEVIPIAEAKEYRQSGGRGGPKERYLPGLHTLRRTYLSVAAECGISELDRSTLVNHSYGRHSVNETYIKQHFGHLAECQATIERALWSRIKGKSKRTTRARRAA